MSSSLRRRTPLRSSRKVPRSRRVDTAIAGRCARCPRPATILQWCRGCAAAVADERQSRFVRARDERCVRCGTRSDLTMAHILGRGAYPRLRFDERNVKAACWDCHQLLDGNPAYKERFFEDLHPGLQSMLRDLARRLPRVDLVEILERYGAAA